MKVPEGSARFRKVPGSSGADARSRFGGRGARGEGAAPPQGPQAGERQGGGP